MRTHDEHLLLTAQWAADCLLRPDFDLQADRAEAAGWILEDSMNVRELLLASALDLGLRILRLESTPSAVAR